MTLGTVFFLQSCERTISSTSMCCRGSEPETTVHFPLSCQNHIISRSKLLKNVYNLHEVLRNYDNDP